MGGLRALTNAIVASVELFYVEPLSTVMTWLLALVFGWSGAIKLRHPIPTALAMADFGVVRRPTRTHGLALGSWEFALGCLMAVGAATGGVSRTIAFGIAVPLLYAFVGLIAHSLIEGNAFPCYCFGDSESRLSVLGLLRTITLAGLATATFLGSFGDQMHMNWTDTILALTTAMSLLGTGLLLGRLPMAWRMRDQIVGDVDL